MKRKFTKLTAVILAAVTALGITAYAATNSQNIDIYFRNIKIMIDGAEYIAKDANGNVVEPFIYNGTTYLPVRGIANAFGKDVVWDGENATVYLGKKDQNAPDNRLDKLQYSDYREGSTWSSMERINGSITDYNGNTYTNGLVFYSYDNGSNIQVDYPLNGQYSTLKGKIVLPQNIDTTTTTENKCKTSETEVRIFDENEDVLYTATGITASMPFSFDINVKGVNKITIKIYAEGDYSYVALTDLALYE